MQYGMECHYKKEKYFTVTEIENNVHNSAFMTHCLFYFDWKMIEICTDYQKIWWELKF